MGEMITSNQGNGTILACKGDTKFAGMNFPKEVEGCGERIDLQVLHQSSHSLAFGKVTSFGNHFDGVLN